MSEDDIITNFALLEYPFMLEGITHAEYDEERDYFIHHYEDYKKETINLCGNKELKLMIIKASAVLFVWRGYHSWLNANL